MTNGEVRPGPSDFSARSTPIAIRLSVTVAEDYYLQAEALAAELGMRPLVAHCHLGLGRLYQRTAKRERAHEHLTTAMTMYREMGMRYWLEQVEAEVKESA